MSLCTLYILPNFNSKSAVWNLCTDPDFAQPAQPTPILPFHNPELDAVNVREINVDPALLEPLRHHLDSYRQNPEFHVQWPSWNSDIAWISPNSPAMDGPSSNFLVNRSQSRQSGAASITPDAPPAP